MLGAAVICTRAQSCSRIEIVMKVSDRFSDHCALSLDLYIALYLMSDLRMSSKRLESLSYQFAKSTRCDLDIPVRLSVERQ